MSDEPLAVIDACVALKWALDDEDDVEQAIALRDDAVEGRLRLVAPSLWLYELANGLVSAVRRARLENVTGARSLSHLTALGIELADPHPDETFANALQYRLSAYDAAYVALARELDVPLWTGDRRLHRAARQAADVRWIGTYSVDQRWRNGPGG